MVCAFYETGRDREKEERGRQGGRKGGEVSIRKMGAGGGDVRSRTICSVCGRVVVGETRQ